MLFGLFKFGMEDNANDKQENLDICSLNGGNETCDLIKQLRLKQEELHDIEEKQKKLKERDPELLSSLIKILLAVKHPNSLNIIDYSLLPLRYESYSERIHDFFSMYNGTEFIEQMMLNVSINDIENMCIELKNLKELGHISQHCDEKRSAIEKEITNLKKRLGIE